MKIDKVAVIGAGTMGAGIAGQIANAGEATRARIDSMLDGGSPIRN